MNREDPSNFFVISAPSGAGKTSLVKALIDQKANCRAAISHTTRPKRSEEIDGKDYYFVTENEFSEIAAKGGFLESAKVFDYSYGTSVEEAQRIKQSGMTLILEIDWQGANQVRGIFDNCCSVFILPPSKDELQRRLIKRGQDNENIIKKRLSAAQEEMKHYKEADFIIVNDDFQTSCSRLKAILGKHTECIATNTDDSQFNVLLSNLLS